MVNQAQSVVLHPQELNVIRKSLDNVWDPIIDRVSKLRCEYILTLIIKPFAYTLFFTQPSSICKMAILTRDSRVSSLGWYVQLSALFRVLFDPHTDSTRMEMAGPHQAPHSSLRIGVTGKTFSMQTRTTMARWSPDFITKPR